MKGRRAEGEKGRRTEQSYAFGSALRVGATAVIPPLRGSWPYGSALPGRVTVLGTSYQRTPWAWPRSGVIAQYRETRPENSKHLFVLRGGTFIVPHTDEVNPDLGSPLEHLVRDVMKRPVRTSLEAELRKTPPPL